MGDGQGEKEAAEMQYSYLHPDEVLLADVGDGFLEHSHRDARGDIEE